MKEHHKNRISRKVQALAPSGIREFFELVLNMKDVISLGVGEPDFVSPWHIRESAVASLEQGYTSYTSNKGMPELRRQIARFLKGRYGLRYDPEEQILITVGVSEALDLAVRAMLNPGEKVIIPEPVYVSYGPVVELAGGEVVPLVTRVEDGFKITPDQLSKACRSGARALMINYPCNPTGASYSRTELLALARVVKKHNLIVISDEVYDELTYDFDHTPLASLPAMKEQTIYLNGFSKAYAMTGFRIGWACGPADLIGAMTKIHQYTMLCASITGQFAALEALKRGAPAVCEMKKEYLRRRNFMVESLNEIGFTCHRPEGAFYVFPSIQACGVDAMTFAKELLKAHRVAIVPGTAFGKSGEGFVRMSYASSFDNLKEAVHRMAVFLKDRFNA